MSLCVCEGEHIANCVVIVTGHIAESVCLCCKMTVAVIGVLYGVAVGICL